jgi:integrase
VHISPARGGLTLRSGARTSRSREHLTSGEVDTLIEAAKASRHGYRDATMILMSSRHGLRAAKVCDLRGGQGEFDAAVLHVRRVKNGTPSTHRLIADGGDTQITTSRNPAAIFVDSLIRPRGVPHGTTRWSTRWGSNNNRFWGRDRRRHASG